MTIETALEHHLAGRLPEAEAGYLAILRAQPQHATALCLLGVVTQQSGKLERALELLRQAVALEPANPIFLTTLANLLKDQNQLDEAVNLYRQAIAANPQNLEALFNLASVLQLQRQFAAAVECYQRAITLKPDYAEAHNDLGVAHMALSEFDQAISSFKNAIACKPDFSDALNNLGVTFKNQGKYDEAIECYRRALAIKPDYAKALFNLGTIYFIRKDFKETMKWYQKSLAADPGQIEVHQNVASMLLDEGRLDEAQQHRDIAYRKQAVFIDTAAHPLKTVLVLWAAGKGNVPIEFLLPKTSYTRIVWMMEYSNDEQARSLPEYDLVFNAIGDEDVTGPTAAPVQHFLKTCSKPVLNLPLAVAKTTRDQIPGLFATLTDVVAPPTLRIPTAELKQTLLAHAELRFPVIVRPGNSHGGDHLIKLENAQDLHNLVLFNAEVYYATAYHDYLSPDGYFRKYRIVFVDKVPYAYHMGIGPHWIVHYDTAEMKEHPWKLQEEVRFLENPRLVIGDIAMNAIEKIGHIMNLDYCGIDFSVLPDGKVLVFEANATMLVHPEAADSVLAHKNPYVQKIYDAFNAMLARITKI